MNGIRTDKERYILSKLKNKVVEQDTLVYLRNMMVSSEFLEWYSDTERLIILIFGENSYEVQYFRDTTSGIYANAVRYSGQDYVNKNKEWSNIIRRLLEEIIF